MRSAEPRTNARGRRRSWPGDHTREEPISESPGRLPLRRFALTISGLMLVAASRPLNAQSPRAIVFVEAADGETGLPLEGAQVQLAELGRFTHAGSMGEAWFRGIAPGAYTVVVRRIGYEPLSARVAVGDREDTLEVTLFLRRSAQQLPEVTTLGNGVVGQNPGLREFARHRQRGFGRFIVTADLEQEGVRPIAIVLFSRVPGLRVVTDPDHVRTYLFSTRGGHLTLDSKSRVDAPPGVCADPVQVYLDGVYLTDPDLSTIDAADLAAVEFYDGNEVPVEYRRAKSDCGVLVLWTKW